MFTKWYSFIGNNNCVNNRYNRQTFTPNSIILFWKRPHEISTRYILPNRGIEPLHIEYKESCNTFCCPAHSRLGIFTDHFFIIRRPRNARSMRAHILRWAQEFNLRAQVSINELAGWLEAARKYDYPVTGARRPII